MKGLVVLQFVDAYKKSFTPKGEDREIEFAKLIGLDDDEFADHNKMKVLSLKPDCFDKFFSTDKLKERFKGKEIQLQGTWKNDRNSQIPVFTVEEVLTEE